jgi:DNA helicase-4
MATSPSTIAPGFIGKLLFPSVGVNGFSLDASSMQVDGLGSRRRVHYLSLHSLPTLEEGTIWSSLHLRVDDRTVSLRGLKKAEAAEFQSAAKSSIGAYLSTELAKRTPELRKLADELDGMSSRYLRHSQMNRWLPALSALETVLKSPLLHKQASADAAALLDRLKGCLNNPERTRSHLNDAFVANELARFKGFFDTVESKPLTEMQRLACVVNEDSNLVLAGAGSGKTSVIIGRAGYLVESGQARPDEILILAFGNKASRETQERIAKRLPGQEGIVAKTFHSLGLEIIGQVTGRKPNVSKLAGDELTFGRYLLATIQDLSKKDRGYATKVLTFLANHLKPYAGPETFETKASYVEYLKALDTRTLLGERVKSQEEVAVANFLALNGIKYEYEADFKLDTATPNRARYRPDFFLPKHGIYIEHFGIDEFGRTPPFIDQEEYTAGIEWKRKIHIEHASEPFETRLVETYSHQVRDGILFDELERQLKELGVEFAPLSLDDLIAKNTDKNSGGNQLTKLFSTFMTLYKSSGKDITALRTTAKAARDGGRSALFLQIFEPVLSAYTLDLRASNEVDFNDMINEAASCLAGGRFASPYKYVLVDEFQDMSLARANLLRALLRCREDANVFCVGDDWQSIFRFTGSDIRLTSQFGEQFGHARIVALDLTFRFNDKISDFASTFVMKNQAQMKKTIRTLRKEERPAITLVQHAGTSNEAAIQKCLDEIDKRAKPGEEVYFLGRYTFNNPAILDELKRAYPRLKFKWDTAHASKGSEGDYVIVLDVNDGRLGFPSQVEDDPLLRLVLPAEEPFPFAEERRLFYVALTRAKHHTYILSSLLEPSVFVKELLERQGIDYEFDVKSAEGGDAPVRAEAVPCPSACGGKLDLRPSQYGKPYYTCNNYPYCEERANRCDKCNDNPLVRLKDAYRCAGSACGHVKRLCPSCRQGELVEKTSQYGPFLSCSNFRRGTCRYKENLAAR